MSGWGIADTASKIEKIKAESADYLHGLDSCGIISWSTYSDMFDFYADLIEKAYEQGKEDAQPERKTGRMSNKDWIDFLCEQFDISRTSAREMLHGMMKCKKEDDFKRVFNPMQKEGEE